MARRFSLLAPAMAPKTVAEVPLMKQQAIPAPGQTPRASGRRPGKYHLGAYFDPDDPVAEAFRVLAARTRRSHQDLLAEAVGDLVARYEADQQFGRR